MDLGRRLTGSRSCGVSGADHLQLGETLLEVTTPEKVARAHAEGHAWQNWFSGDDRDAPATRPSLVAICVDGIMTSRPRALERALARTERPPRCN
jgi:hypothetical protein